MDISKLNVDGAKWWRVLKQWRNGKDIDGIEVRKLLESGDPVPVDANQMLADIVAGEAKLKRGNRAMYNDDILKSPELVVGIVRRIEGCIKDPAKLGEDADDETRAHYQELHRRSKLKRTQAKITPNAAAVKHAAIALDVSKSHVRTKIGEYNKYLKRMAQKYGITIEEAERRINLRKP